MKLYQYIDFNLSIYLFIFFRRMVKVKAYFGNKFLLKVML